MFWWDMTLEGSSTQEQEVVMMEDGSRKGVLEEMQQGVQLGFSAPGDRGWALLRPTIRLEYN